MTDFLDGLEAFLQSSAPEEVAVAREDFQELSAVGPDADPGKNGRSRAATLGRYAMRASRKERR